ncbi:hypothetical protein SELMODRAFT_117026 [Selaginella moellendorffii]|uniref:Uncharacterized protein n=1 Tax=Selaginella moellendorffii TaxID=88036 RepID=D8SHF5_SELML|nr:abscisic acid receptor PYL8 [Selaginella moellendorffii]XP_002990956.1 abscisic acid receptor PYL8 [Selaginella moellendorffii]EFJ08000.1 hypothetical protein SELMODRAFT_161269 [Selaginella moellendorffii]EFJ16101.1 hypothetical protein SELMODRAFT_117026 [Selaginella moellendorffii]|eukprot:XP_002982856.1 abscisic acid receptor PYL8 [Selaginella moellendorffii]
MSSNALSREEEHIWRYHKHEMQEYQCGSILIKRINAPVQLVWSLVRRFDQPQGYKRFIQSCTVNGDGKVGSIRNVNVVTGLPATSSTERLEILDEEEHIFSYRILGGDHRLKNYWSIITLHSEMINGRPGTLAIESYVVDTPEGNSKEDTCFFVETVIKCNLKSLADVSERLALQTSVEHLTLASRSP